jgi:SpoVK/Ycf46/Vps4 family AAA+-type ATPase
MNVISVKLYNRAFKQNSANSLENKASKFAIDENPSDEFISSKNTTTGNKKNNTWKWILSGVITVVLIVGLFIEKKASNTAKAEKETAEKAKKELEEKLKKEKEELEKKLKEEQKKWDDFFKNNPTNNEKKASPTNNSTSSNNTNSTGGNSASSNSSSPSQNGKNPRQSVNTQSTHTENHSGGTSSSQNKSKIETLKDLQEKTKVAEAEIQRMKNLELKNKIMNGVDEINNTLGLSKVVGYTNVKNIFANKFINPVTKNQKEMIPNIIFMYGPKGTGKTFIANSVAEEAQCNIIHLEPTLDTTNDLEGLKQVVQKAKMHYQTTNQRSVIIVDEIDSLLNTSDNHIIYEYKDLINNISNNGATIIGTTNHPQDINKEFYNITKFEKIYLPPMPKEDMPDMIKHYADIIADSSVNYSELADLIYKRAGENAYSNDRIASIVKHKAKSINSLLEDGAMPQMLTHQHLVNAINESTPDISKEILDSYKKI